MITIPLLLSSILATPIDGDTLRVEAPWLPTSLGNTISLRLEGVNTPELHSKDCPGEHELAVSALDYVTKLLNLGPYSISYSKWDKFGGRILGSIETSQGDLATLLIENGYGTPYHGERKPKCFNLPKGKPLDN